MGTQTKPLKDLFLDSAIDIAFLDLADLHKHRRLPRRISLTGMDPTSLTYAVAELGYKLGRHEVEFFNQESSGASPMDLGRYYGRALARKWHDDNPAWDTGAYVVAEGFDSNVREGFVFELGQLAEIEAYSEPQFPNSRGKLLVNLEEFASSPLAI